MAKNLKKGKTICVASAKGGVGKTTTVLNLAGIYEVMEKRILIIDLDLTNGGIALALNKPYTKSVVTIMQDLSINTYQNFKDYVTKYDKYIDILPCPIDPRDATKIDTCLIDIILERASFIYDVILIDTTHYLNEINLYTLDKVDEILYIITNDPINLKNMKSLISIFNNLGINNYHILLNEACNPFKRYFSLFDIKNTIKANIDYTLSQDFFISDIDNYVMNGNIITLDKKIPNIFSKDYTSLMNIAIDLLEGEKNE